MNSERPIYVLGCVTIDSDSYRTDQRHHELGDMLMERFGYKPEQVREMRITEGIIEVDLIKIDRVVGDFHFFTERHTM